VETPYTLDGERRHTMYNTLGTDNGHDVEFRVPRYVAPEPVVLDYAALMDVAAGEYAVYDDAA
jgi:hypothetical protein